LRNVLLASAVRPVCWRRIVKLFAAYAEPTVLSDRPTIVPSQLNSDAR
jgi:hypothetical protein